MDKVKKYLLIILIIFFSVIFAVYSKETSVGIIKSIDICIDVIIPSMFTYMVISDYIISSGLYNIIFKPAYFLLYKVIKLDKRSMSVFLLSLIGGYPVGIKMLSELIAENKNYSAIAEKSAVFSYCISPTFAITMIGLGVYNSAEIGMVVYVSNVISNIIIAAIYTRLYNLNYNEKNIKNNGNIIQSINSSTGSLVRICSVIIIFNAGITAICSVLKELDIYVPSLLNALLEISNILSIDSPKMSYLPIISMLSSIGGVCVIFQCYSIIQNKFSIKSFLIGRIPIAVLSGLITFIIIKVHNFTLPASAYERSEFIFNFDTNRIIILLMLIMCVIIFQKNEKIFKKG